MRYRPIDSEPLDPQLGRFVPDDWSHVESYPLSAIPAAERPVRRPVVIGVNWYEEFWYPEERDGEAWLPTALSAVRGGHCVCLEPGGQPDREEWYRFYDQGHEGACVGFGWSRCMTILNDELYSARWLWDRSKEIDQWPETKPGDDQGTSVRAAGEILRDRGAVDWREDMSDDEVDERYSYTASRDNGIRRFRWARSVEEVHAVLGDERGDELGAVRLLNSWGPSYPHRVWMPDEVLDRLMREDGEIAIPTDR